MRTINETFTDEEFEKLKDVKGDLNWHDFILKLTEERDKKNEKK